MIIDDTSLNISFTTQNHSFKDQISEAGEEVTVFAADVRGGKFNAALNVDIMSYLNLPTCTSFKSYLASYHIKVRSRNTAVFFF